MGSLSQATKKLDQTVQQTDASTGVELGDGVPQPRGVVPQAQAAAVPERQEQGGSASGNPGMPDVQASPDVELSTSDNTIRRRAGKPRDPGIRI